jgi:putative hydroxymethylpyrimidine transport system substrate-binding protein
MRRISLLLAATAILVAAAAGCGDEGHAGGRRPVPLVIGLDFTPNAVHAPIYMAVRNGYDRRHGASVANPPAWVVARFA